jgi:lipoate-protein ligase A
VRVLSVVAPALVLGSTQQLRASAAPAVAGVEVEVVRRRSGGGAVLLRPGETVWVDVLVPAGDPLREDDVARSFWWLGSAWAAALGGGSLSVHQGPMVRTRWSSDVCFAGVGPGEVLDGAGGGKVVGMASRRTRLGALFQCAVPLAWDAAAYVRLLGLPADAEADLAAVAAPVSLSADDVVTRFLAALP